MFHDVGEYQRMHAEAQALRAQVDVEKQKGAEWAEAAMGLKEQRNALRAQVEQLAYFLRIYVHAHDSGNAMNVFIAREAKAALAATAPATAKEQG